MPTSYLNEFHPMTKWNPNVFFLLVLPITFFVFFSSGKVNHLLKEITKKTYLLYLLSLKHNDIGPIPRLAMAADRGFCFLNFLCSQFLSVSKGKSFYSHNLSSSNLIAVGIIRLSTIFPDSAGILKSICIIWSPRMSIR